MLESYIPVSLNGEGEVAAIFDIKTLEYGRRLITLLNVKNELHSWVEELYHGCGWLSYDRKCGRVHHDEMISIFGN